MTYLRSLPAASSWRTVAPDAVVEAAWERQVVHDARRPLEEGARGEARREERSPRGRAGERPGSATCSPSARCVAWRGRAREMRRGTPKIGTCVPVDATAEPISPLNTQNSATGSFTLGSLARFSGVLLSTSSRNK